MAVVIRQANEMGYNVPYTIEQLKRSKALFLAKGGYAKVIFELTKQISR